MENSAKTPQKKESKHFWGFPFTHFTYFFMWQIIFGYLTLWMEQVGHMNGAEAGVVFSAMAGLSLLFQPAFGVISDKLLFKKNLLFTIAIAAMLIGPYFQWVFMPLMHINSMLVAIVTGIYLCFIFNGGVSVIEQYVQRASLANGFEYGHSRMGGSLAGMVASFVGGQIFLWHPNSIFWACTISATILTGLLLFSDKVDMDNASAAGDTSNSLDLSMIGKIFKLKNFWYLSIFYIGTSAIYDVFDQQFIIFFKSFFNSAAAGTQAYSYMTTAQIGLEFLLMFPMPWIINRIGSRNGLIAYGVILAIRIIGSALSPSLIWVIFLRLLAGFEMPLVLVSIMKYIAGAFDVRVYATVYALASNFAKQISVFIFSAVAGNMYDAIGFHHTYLILGAIVAVVTLFAAFVLKKENKLQAGEVDEQGNAKS
ncbi:MULTISPECIES: oligosaccharide MFS transporter [Lentilactobacillus]|uniref:Galactoside permease n=2 Tax=Lentilactobacillus kisonensis TaxID=481722 RepID=A0A0R1P3F4_9LACO|nr:MULTISPECIES: oligosaccharide MFS transporter [Lentilactobacillus]EHO49151.1 putative galactoside permease [Lentilactobacillus kisonensis F0435]KRL23064.1 galactoside permease [Lentilactobacillus kisonensis DSM 19906 = JCM 15041]MBU9789878.1 oligosaccharide MFS transporter [Lentilactobacillus dabitei]